jgi:predicted nucleotidyltransferase component of viral defense system
LIPQADIIAWRRVAPWADDGMVEQDLVLSRALVEIFSDPALAQALAFRGGTALHKVVLAPPSRYSEDLDLVQPHGRDLGGKAIYGRGSIPGSASPRGSMRHRPSRSRMGLRTAPIGPAKDRDQHA